MISNFKSSLKYLTPIANYCASTMKHLSVYGKANGTTIEIVENHTNNTYKIDSPLDTLIGSLIGCENIVFCKLLFLN